jgi:hypothetical protein
VCGHWASVIDTLVVVVVVVVAVVAVVVNPVTVLVKQTRRTMATIHDDHQHVPVSYLTNASTDDDTNTDTAAVSKQNLIPLRIEVVHKLATHCQVHGMSFSYIASHTYYCLAILRL